MTMQLKKTYSYSKQRRKKSERVLV